MLYKLLIREEKVKKLETFVMDRHYNWLFFAIFCRFGVSSSRIVKLDFKMVSWDQQLVEFDERCNETKGETRDTDIFTSYKGNVCA